MSTSSELNLSAAGREALGRAALEWCLRYFDTLESLRVYPVCTAPELRERFNHPVPQQPGAIEELIAECQAISDNARHNSHPRMFGYVQSSGTFAGAIADLIASTLNQNVTSWRSAPSATTIERQMIAWIASLIDAPSHQAGLFLSGGSMANFAGLATALRQCTDVDIAQRGVAVLSHTPRVYASSMTHMSIAKAAGLLGLGRDAVFSIPVNAAFEMDPAALDGQLTADRAAGKLPVCVVATAGDVNTGAVDSLDRLADVCARHGVWMHVDASYGGFAAMAQSVRARFAGLDRADSIALDPHKWLYAPLDVGCLLVRDPASLRRAFTHGAAYVDVIADEHMSEFAFWDYGPELSRRFRALKIWFALKLHGARAFADGIESNLQVARHLASRIDDSDDFERLAPVPLSIVCFRYLPRELRDRLAAGDPQARAELNSRNRTLMLEVQRRGNAYLSNAEINGAFALRACIVNFRTTLADADELLTEIRRVAVEAYRDS